MMCERQGKSRLKLDLSFFNSELFFVRTHMYVHTQKYVDTYCIRLSNYITPNICLLNSVTSKLLIQQHRIVSTLIYWATQIHYLITTYFHEIYIFYFPEQHKLHINFFLSNTFLYLINYWAAQNTQLILTRAYTI